MDTPKPVPLATLTHLGACNVRELAYPVGGDYAPGPVEHALRPDPCAVLLSVFLGALPPDGAFLVQHPLTTRFSGKRSEWALVVLVPADQKTGALRTRGARSYPFPGPSSAYTEALVALMTYAQARGLLVERHHVTLERAGKSEEVEARALRWIGPQE